ncbi:MAG: NAD-dependent epimerase/dehydratase family protein [Alysiella sp.]|uniref:NAD-dependent epimerase/dehydratase family protein n=1 Tax=Alysiella sp. TaxID=1872483 RepID=UPI0026DDAD0A|nr:NAD-dependent epimerase/dehydratase family protein [Alysiella sp.]MDO4434529.1 NAD-dependent epimerase/dehydratase family protein [Alysiella sp.]
MNTSILIIGMGFLGRPLAERCHQYGMNVRAVKRQQTSDDINLPIHMDFVALSPTFRQPEWSNYPTWVILLPPTGIKDYTATIAQLTQHAHESQIKHLIYASSISVYGNQARQCDEHSSLNPESQSAQSIVAAEQSCLNTGIDHTDILRLAGLYAAERHPINSLLQRQNIKGAAQAVNMLHRDRAVAALFQAALNPNGTRIRNIVENDHLSRQVFYRREAQSLGLPEPHWDTSDTDTNGRIITSLYTDLT